MSDFQLIIEAEPLSVPPSQAEPAHEHAPLRAGERIGTVHVLACDPHRVELRTPGELGFGRALVGMVPVLWCAAAWTMCLREHLLDQRLRGCVALTLMAAASAALMFSSMGVVWRFDGKRRRITRRVGLLGRRTHNARRLAGLKLESTRASALNDVQLRMTLVDATGAEQFEIAAWKRREIDRAQVDALAAQIRATMGWPAVTQP